LRHATSRKDSRSKPFIYQTVANVTALT